MLTYGEAALEEVTFKGEAVTEASRVREAARRYILSKIIRSKLVTNISLFY